MKSSRIMPITKDFIVRLGKRRVVLPLDIQKKIDAYWEDLLASGKSYTRGEVFTVTKKNIIDSAITILVEKTDYAHYLYCQNIDSLGENGIHIIHTSAFIETFDEYIIFGEMGHQTSRAGVYQFCGGGIDNDDLRGDRFDFVGNITKELLEELGIDVADASRVAYCRIAYFKEGGSTNKMTVIFTVSLKETRDEFLKKYEQFVKQLQKQGIFSEFGKIVALKKKKEEIEKFFHRDDIVFDECMKPFFSYIGLLN